MAELHPSVTAFYQQAKAYCQFIDAMKDGSDDRPFTHLLELLTNLASSVLQLPADYEAVDVPEIPRINQDQWSEIARAINSVAGKGIAKLMDYYIEGKDFDNMTRADMLFDDLADIYRDLFDGIQYYQRNEQDDIGQAIWAWRWGYEHHWGEHMYTALKTVHEIRYFMEMP